MSSRARPRDSDVDSEAPERSRHRVYWQNYMATEDRSWDSSTAHIRRTLRASIEYGRRSGGREDEDLWEAYRLLGTVLHTLEDLLAHSNWCFVTSAMKLSLTHPTAKPPLSFGSADFMHSMMGEATDHISQSSVTDLSQKMNEAKNSDSESLISNFRGVFNKLPIGGGDGKMNEAEELKSQSEAYDFNPDNVAPPEVRQKLLQLLRWRDDLMRDILEKIEMIPGLSDLIDTFADTLNAYVFSVLAPWLAPILSHVTKVLGEGSKAVIDTADQYEVFNDPRASGPSHSLLSKYFLLRGMEPHIGHFWTIEVMQKSGLWGHPATEVVLRGSPRLTLEQDHFGLILNEPAGVIAKQVVRYTVNNVVQAWQEESEDPDRVIGTILEAFHRPYYSTGRSQIQCVMFETMERWINDLSDEERETTLRNLMKSMDGTVAHTLNSRATAGDSRTPAETTAENRSDATMTTQAAAGTADGNRSRNPTATTEDRTELVRNPMEVVEKMIVRKRQSYDGGYGGGHEEYGRRRNEDTFGDRGNESYGSRHDENPYGSRRDEDAYGAVHRQGYGEEDDGNGCRKEEDSYGGPRGEDAYGSRRGEDLLDGPARGGYRPPYGRSPGREYGHREESEGYSGGGYERNEGDFGAGYDRPPPPGRGGFGEEDEGDGAGGYSRGRYDGGDLERRGYGENEETFGVERLALGEDEEGGRYERRRGYRSGEYGGGGYEPNY
ncbi:heterokaryon incompatibility protein Het-C-domain-containing protein [Vararia minispora EC-137]|uniref:Heterokaryon incompatibility protein Het-C-domain-containing protein n=1 Tax=Vararia minispora EC-137 TaxID=1314806 RepID=A0ACB8QU20_9AGAM|nr:heterokaryon incompatibility protein Het-C-domain-containing protein [Vararia minispora EC-137]